MTNESMKDQLIDKLNIDEETVKTWSAHSNDVQIEQIAHTEDRSEERDSSEPVVHLDEDPIGDSNDAAEIAKTTISFAPVVREIVKLLNGSVDRHMPA